MGEIGVGLIGTGFMGKCHALAFRAAPAVFGDLPTVRLETLCDTPADRARAMAEQFGFARATDDWCALVADPAVDLVSITAPNGLHREMALAALAAGKHVWCEKPMALTLDDARAMRDAAQAAGARTLLGYNYCRNPALEHARQLIEGGAIGRVAQFRGVVDEDYLADADAPWSWRCLRAEGGLGALGDIGVHLIAAALMLMGPVESLTAETQTIHAARPRPGGGGMGPVENEDAALALLRFRSGARGSLAISRSAWGRKNRIGIEVQGDRGTLVFEQERMNELRLYRAGEDLATSGFRTILTGPAHEPYGAFCPAPGHGMGFNDLKVIEATALLRSLSGGPAPWPDFAAGFEIERIAHGIVEAATSDRRLTLKVD
jgi:predicted dehydrogenase